MCLYYMKCFNNSFNSNDAPNPFEKGKIDTKYEYIFSTQIKLDECNMFAAEQV